jgi:hypothetical protein
MEKLEPEHEAQFPPSSTGDVFRGVPRRALISHAGTTVLQYLELLFEPKSARTCEYCSLFSLLQTFKITLFMFPSALKLISQLSRAPHPCRRLRPPPPTQPPRKLSARRA